MFNSKSQRLTFESNDARCMPIPFDCRYVYSWGCTICPPAPLCLYWLACYVHIYIGKNPLSLRCDFGSIRCRRKTYGLFRWVTACATGPRTAQIQDHNHALRE